MRFRKKELTAWEEVQGCVVFATQGDYLMSIHRSRGPEGFGRCVDNSRLGGIFNLPAWWTYA